MAPKTPTVRTTRRRLRALDAPATDLATLDEHLPRLAGVIHEATAAFDRPQLVRVYAKGEHVELGFRDVDDLGGNAVDALCGFTAPATWLGVGLATGGTARWVDDPDAPPRRAHVVHLVTRSGASGNVVQLEGEEPKHTTEHGPLAYAGRADDACRRALGLPTAPPSRSTLALWATVWLERVLGTEIERLASPATTMTSSWQEVADLHPAIEVLLAAEPSLHDEAVRRLARLGQIHAEVQTWSAVRTACAAGRWSWPDIPPAWAEWLDDGAFSRWVLQSLPDLHDLVATVCELLSGRVGRRVASTVRAWHLLGSEP